MQSRFIAALFLSILTTTTALLSSPPFLRHLSSPSALSTTFRGGSITTTTTTLQMSSVVKEGDTLPLDLVLKEGQANYEKPVDVTLGELLKGKKVAIFGVPGAFTPGCSKSHLPSFITAQDDLKAKGVDLTICVATNDAYVMEAWGSSSGGAEAGIRFLSDSNAELAKALGLALEKGIMVRCARFSLIADDGVVTNYFSASENSSDTWAPNVLAAL